MISLLDPNGGPLYGLSANVAPPPLAAMLSVVLILGVDAIGLMTLRSLRLGDFEKQPWLRWQVPLVGAALLAVVLYPAALAGSFPRPVAWLVAVTTALAGMVHGWRSTARHMASRGAQATRISRPGPQDGILDVLLLLVVAGLGLLALGPVTEADSLDYHVGVAISILNSGAFPFSPEWFTSRLAGSGEVLIALGLAIGAEQFGSLLQYSGVLGVVGIFRSGFPSADPALHEPTGRWRKTIALAVTSTPVFIAWAASPKPMLLPVAMTTAALMVVISMIAGKSAALPSWQRRSAFVLVCLLVMAASVMKMNFLLSGAIVGAVAFGYMATHRQIAFALAAGIAGALLIMAPPVVWKHAYYGGTLSEALLTPFPGNWPGTGEFEAMLRAYRDTQLPFPLSLLIPAGPGTATTVLGLGLFFSMIALARFRPGNSRTAVLVAAASIVTVLGAILGQRNARFFLEPYFWLLIATMVLWAPRSDRAARWLSGAIAVQSILVLAMIGIGIVTLSSGALTAALRERTMARHASGHTVMEWVAGALPPDARLIVEPRSIALAPRFAIANDWRAFVPYESGGEQMYGRLVKAQSPDFILVRTAPDVRPAGFRCEEDIYAGPFRTEEATRNPFNSGARFDAWIMRIDSQERSECH